MNHIATVKETLFRFFAIDLKAEHILPLSTTKEKHRDVIWKNINTFTRWHGWAACCCEHWEQFDFGSISRGCEQGAEETGVWRCRMFTCCWLSLSGYQLQVNPSVQTGESEIKKLHFQARKLFPFCEKRLTQSWINPPKWRGKSNI